MQLYNTLSRKKEDFIPLREGKVSLYACGITTYDFCHIGHARSAIVFDVLVRYLRYKGLSVTFVRNFTDVDDKIITRANFEGKTSKEISETYIKAFHDDMDRLGVIRADHEPKATEHIADMINLCEELIKKEHAYSTPSGDVYFRVRSFPQYGKLSGRSIDDMKSGARILPGEEKEDPLDFALWKGAKPDEPSWDSPWGKGRPGWHIECSAMSEQYLPLPIDIHGGGLDLIFPHHENEIAQTEALTGKDFARFWIHNGFVQINSEKMSKSLGNFKTIRDLLEITLPEVLRYFLLTRHYRSPIDYSLETIEEAEKNVKRLYEALHNIDKLMGTELKTPDKLDKTAEELKVELDSLLKAWDESMEDDLNTAAALGHLNSILRLGSRIMEEKGLKKNPGAIGLLPIIRKECSKFGAPLGLFQRKPLELLAELKDIRVRRKKINVDELEQLMQERLEARKNKDFATADSVRDKLIAMGVEVQDTSKGPVWDIA